jgi:putative ABC transport system permease protein
MTWWHRLFRRRKNEEELEKELCFHLDLHTSDLIARGHSPEEAQRRARLALGGPEQVKEKCRDVRRTRWLSDVIQDLRFAGRMWRKSPGFTLFAVCGLALAIGANTAVFTFVNAVLFRNLPFRGSDRIVYLATFETPPGPEPLQAVSYLEYLDYKERLQSFEGLAACQVAAGNLSDNANFPERYFGVRVTANGLSVIGHKPMLGRDLEPADMQAGAPPVVILSYRLWERRYNKDGSVIGKTVLIDEIPVTVVGVTAPGVMLPLDNDLWLPLAVPPAGSSREVRDLLAFGRLAGGVGIGQASAEAATVASQLKVEHPATNKNVGAEVQDVNESFYHARFRHVTKALWGGIAFVLLIACVNAASLLLGRSLIRSREMSIRAALGAGRSRVIRQLLTESVLLSVAAGALGVFLAYFGVRALKAFLEATGYKPYSWATLSVDGDALLYLSGISIVTGVVFGLAPALRMSRVDLSNALREGGQGGGVSRGRRLLSGILVVAEVALSVVLLMGAGLMIRSMMNAGNQKLGVNTSNVLTMFIDLPPSKYPRPQDRASFFQELRTRIEALPGVETAAVLSELPGNGIRREPTTTFQLETSPIEDKGSRPRTASLTVGPGYFRCMRALLLQGREFTELDGASGHEATIINQSFASRHWPGQNPLGKRISVDDQGTDPWLTIVGVVADIVQNDYSEGLPTVYLPYLQSPGRGMHIAARTRVVPAGLSTAFRQSARDLDANLPVSVPRSLEDHISSSHPDTRLFGMVFTVLAIIALILTSTGLYAVISQSVNQRTREIAIRSAMGASAPRLWWLMFSQGMRQFTIGLVIGSALSFAAGRVFSQQLVGISSSDPLTYLLVVSVVTIAAALACGLPARRAARSDPATALRFE